eukprot:5790194-Amphidinium_carterae.1
MCIRDRCRRRQRGRPTKVPRMLQRPCDWSNGDESAWLRHEHRSGSAGAAIGDSSEGREGCFCTD